jgi:hypothetical protein
MSLTLQFMVLLRLNTICKVEGSSRGAVDKRDTFAGDARHVRKMCLAYRRGHPICKNHGSELEHFQFADQLSSTIFTSWSLPAYVSVHLFFS